MYRYSIWIQHTAWIVQFWGNDTVREIKQVSLERRSTYCWQWRRDCMISLNLEKSIQMRSYILPKYIYQYQGSLYEVALSISTDWQLVPIITDKHPALSYLIQESNVLEKKQIEQFCYVSFRCQKPSFSCKCECQCKNNWGLIWC